MHNPLNYYFTTYGDVYVGDEFCNPQLPDYRVIIQRPSVKDYLKLPAEDRTIKKIGEFGWAIPNNVIADVVSLDVDQHNKIKSEHEPTEWEMQYDRKIMFILGAGASSFCVRGEPFTKFQSEMLRPPLGLELFHERFREYHGRYPGVRQSLHFLRSGDVETLLEEEWDAICNDGNERVMARHINIQYYLQELLRDVTACTVHGYGDVNLYTHLADACMKAHSKKPNGKRKFAFVSFNQDTILENTLMDYFDTKLQSIDDYVDVNRNPYCVFKPHGSWNWGWQFPHLEDKSMTTADWLFKSRINYFTLYYQQLGNYRDMIEWGSWGIESLHDKHRRGKYGINKSKISLINYHNLNVYYPALLLPYRDKDEFTMPTRHYMNMRNYLSHVETLIIIGWKGNEAAFNGLLASEAHRISRVIIADPNPKLIEDNLGLVLSKPGVEVVRYKSFEHLINEGLLKSLV
jgi:hypothetical protein